MDRLMRVYACLGLWIRQSFVCDVLQSLTHELGGSLHALECLIRTGVDLD